MTDPAQWILDVNRMARDDAEKPTKIRPERHRLARELLDVIRPWCIRVCQEGMSDGKMHIEIIEATIAIAHAECIGLIRSADEDPPKVRLLHSHVKAARLMARAVNEKEYE